MASSCGDPDLYEELGPEAHPFHAVLDEGRRIPSCSACTLTRLLARISLDVEEVLYLLRAIKNCEEEEAADMHAAMEAEGSPSPFFPSFTQGPGEFLGCDQLLLDVGEREEGSAVHGGERLYDIWWPALRPSTSVEAMAPLPFPFSLFTLTPQEFFGFDLPGGAIDAEGRQDDGYELPFPTITQSPEEFLGIQLLAVIDGQQEEELSPSPPGLPDPDPPCSGPRLRPASVNGVEAVEEEEEERAPPRRLSEDTEGGDDDWGDGLLDDLGFAAFPYI